MLAARLHDAVLQLGSVQYWALAAFLALALAVLLVICFRALRYLRMIEDTPTARVRSAAQGFVELEGKVEFPRTPPLTSPLRGIPCVWWSYRVEELAPTGEAESAPWDPLVGAVSLISQLFGARGSGRLVESGSSHECFLMRDGTGACVIDPDQAQIFGAQPKVWVQGTKRFEESVIRVGQRLYALGLFETPQDHAADSERREIGTLISSWKLDRIKLAQRFDANRDGELDASEWDAAWQAATAEVRQRHVARGPAPDLHVLCNPADRRPFVLSVLEERKLASHFWFRSITSLMACAMVATLLVWFLGVRGLI